MTRPPVHTRLLLYLTQHFYDVEMLLTWMFNRKRTGIQKKNAYLGYAASLYGPQVAAAHFILTLKGGLRFKNQSDWFRANTKGKFSWDFVNYKDVQIEEIDLSNTMVNYRGLENLDTQRSLRTLSLKGCPEVDDWFLARLHVFQDSLEELDISHCPHITTGGLAALRNLKGLKRLDVSSLPRIQSPGLVVILLEDMLPKCDIVATGYDYSFVQEDEESKVQHMQGQSA
uniref:Distal membrane-arm assembly complex protein 2 n=2 Tax=Sphaeramia orbicularis TaxID=375764 RepID=A0A673AVU7_9TELE